MSVIQLHPNLTRDQKLEALKRFQFSEQRRCQRMIGLLRDALVVPDADDRAIKSAFENVATIVNKISDIGATIRSVESEKPKPSAFFELAKDICAPPRVPDVMLTTVEERARALRPQEYMK